MNPVWHFLNGVPQIGPLSIGPSAVTSTVPILASAGTALLPSYAYAGDPDSGDWLVANDLINRSLGGVAKYQFSTGAYVLASDVSLGWRSNVSVESGTVDTSMGRGAANRIDIATGDSLRLVSGVLTGGGLLSPLITPTTISTAGIVAYTGAQVAGGLILRDCNGAGRADTVPTAADLLSTIPGAQVGQAVRFTIRNTSGTAVSITVSTATGVTLSGTMTVAQSNSKEFLAVFTNVTAASEAYTLYSLGTLVF